MAIYLLISKQILRLGFSGANAADRPAKLKVECLCSSLPASHLQGNSQDFHSPADPHSPPHRSTGNRKGNFARTSAMPAALRFRVNQVLGHFSKGWELLLSEALWSPQPSDRPLLCLPIPFSLLAHPVFPPDLCPSSDPFTSLTPFFSCPTKTAASLSPL